MIRLALLVTLLTGFDALAQTSELEFGRAFGGEIEGTAKPSRTFSGSLGLTRGNGLFGNRYDATLGGSLANDRLWFFASTTMMPSHTIDWRNVKIAPPQEQTTQPVALPSTLFNLRATSFLSESTVVSVNVTRD